MNSVFNVSRTTWAKGPRVFNVSCRKVGGITFLKIGRFNVSFSISREYKPIGEKAPAICSGPFWDELAAMAADLREVDCGEAQHDR